MQGFEYRGGAGGGDGGGEDIGAHRVFHPVDGVLVGSNEATHRCQALAEGAHDEVHLRQHVEVVAGAAAFTSEDTEAVGFVDHQRGTVAVANLYHLVHMRHIALH